mmetsp:Transcript_118571/g.329558  ORF Transcript_118571/g.329558 Transcript_118571/m.329558 type:complete len:357 (-) Transcript_118571:331-1401(-)|eukprot:CAMPEP_0176226814 /NCGR_PEP_ID=MMETSP0121_2-20121125/22450_1 /TAXON_ID=160619 /ORGANISM="Kryptoperidinium foliaceum, Strain CCMP 1326" /LENGTH=356 /DNA_ID=CAMNT_0017566083 /DNA_START=36 /DNA_END=1106 /DNA_ORIENTATION=-
MGCCEPVKCVGCEPRALGEGPSDSCLCGCLFLNGFLAGLLSQTLLLMGMLFSLAAIGDCSFVTTNSRILLPGEDFEGLPEDLTGFKEFGMFFFARPNGECYWYEEGLYPEDQIDWYINVLTPSWNVARGFSAIGALGGFFLFCYSLSFTCSAQAKGARYFTAFLLSAVLTCFQFLSILAFSSDFCQDNDCSLSRSCSWTIVAGCMYFCTGGCFLLMSDYPGEAILEEEKQRAAYLESHRASSPEEPPIEADAAAFESPTSVSPEEQYDVDPEIVEVDAKVVGEVAPTAVTEKDATATDEEQGKIAAVSSSGTSTKEANEEETTGTITESPLVEGEVLTDEQGHGTKPTTGTSNSEE